MFEINFKEQSPKMEVEQTVGFLGGLNTFQDQTVIRDSELTKAQNIVLSVDGVEPRYGTVNYGDTASDTKIYGGVGFYLSNGTRQFLRVSGGRLKKLNSGSFTQVSATAISNVNTELIQARDKIYGFNGTDNLFTYDGTNITTYTALTTPVGLGVTATGSAGSTPYSYRVSAFNAQGETLACTAVAVANGNATLSSTNYNALAWTATAGATGYNIWGRKATGLGETYLDTVVTNAYNDQGQSDPSTTILPPEGNTTAGVKGKYVCFALQRLFVAGDPDNPSRLSYGGTGSNIGNFSWTLEGGGATDIFKNDGQAIRGIYPFQGGVMVFKDNAIYKFTFDDDGRAKLEEITRAFGGISHRSIKAVENDIIFAARKDGRIAFYSLGNQENFSSAILRTNELSIKIATDLQDVNLAYIDKSAGFYFRNIYGCAIPTSSSTTNNRIWVLDTRFGAWVEWDDLSPAFFMEYTDTDGSQNMYYGDEANGYMVEMFQDDRNDNGSAIDVEFSTKSYNQKNFRKYKEYYDPTFQFKGINQIGSVSGDITIDGSVVEKDFTITELTIGGAGFGAMLFGQPLFGTATGGTAADSASSDQLVEVDTVLEGRSIKYTFRSNSNNLYYKLIGVSHAYMVLEGMRLPQRFRTY